MRHSQAPHNTGDTLRDVHESYRSYLGRNRDLVNHCTQFLKREKSDPAARPGGGCRVLLAPC